MRRWTGRLVVAAAGGLLGAGLGGLGPGPAAALAGEPAQRVVYDDRFTTSAPGAATGRAFDIDFRNPDDPGGKPPAAERVLLELHPGAHFDTSAIPRCAASDPELMIAGQSACPPASKVGEWLVVLDTGGPAAARYVFNDFTGFNAEDELILLGTERESGRHVALRGKVRDNTLEIEIPPLPGTPPDGGADTYESGLFFERGRWLTTPPDCPPSGRWTNSVTYTFRDGVSHTYRSASPCERQAAPAAGRPPAARDSRAPRVRVRRIGNRCARRSVLLRVHVADASRLARVRVSAGRRVVAATSRKRFVTRVPVRRLRPGVRALSVRAWDAAGNGRRRDVRFRRCRS